jgi:hypothetical protein
VRLIQIVDRRGRFLDPLAETQIPERKSRLVEGAMENLLDGTDALEVQSLFRLDRAKMHERITDKLFLRWRHQPSIPFG